MEGHLHYCHCLDSKPIRGKERTQEPWILGSVNERFILDPGTVQLPVLTMNFLNSGYEFPQGFFRWTENRLTFQSGPFWVDHRLAQQITFSSPRVRTGGPQTPNPLSTSRQVLSELSSFPAGRLWPPILSSMPFQHLMCFLFSSGKRMAVTFQQVSVGHFYPGNPNALTISHFHRDDSRLGSLKATAVLTLVQMTALVPEPC